MTEQELKELIKQVIDEMYLDEEVGNTTKNVAGYDAPAWKPARRILKPDELNDEEE